MAYHAGGSPGYPSSWRNPYTGKVWQGTLLGVGAGNVIGIGIERWGAANEPAGPKQIRAMIDLAVDIALRQRLRPEQVVAHKELEADRQGGGVLLAQVREAVSKTQNVGRPGGTEEFDPNPERLSVGPGMLETLKANRLAAYTNEQYFSPNQGQAQRSFLWTTTGECLIAFQ